MKLFEVTTHIKPNHSGPCYECFMVIASDLNTAEALVTNYLQKEDIGCYWCRKISQIDVVAVEEQHGNIFKKLLIQGSK